MSGRKPPRQQKFQDWSETGDFLNKPKSGWLHTSDQLNPNAGVCYSARFLGYVDVRESLMSHNCAMRARAVKESIERLAEEIKLHPKVYRKTTETCGILGKMFVENTDVKFILRYSSLETLALQTDQRLAIHDISEISYVSGEETIPGELEFISYVAKSNEHRACYVYECGGDLAHDIITTIAQTIEIRYKMLLADQGVIPRPKFTTKLYDIYYVCSNKAAKHIAFYTKKGIIFEKKPTKKEQEKMEEKLLSLSFGGGGSVYDNAAPAEVEYDFYDNAKGNPDPDPYSYDDGKAATQDDNYASRGNDKKKSRVFLLDDPYTEYDNAKNTMAQLEYDMDSIYQRDDTPGDEQSDLGKVLSKAPVGQLWFHGKISRQRCDELLHEEGQFVVRESTTAPGQFVLSSFTCGRIRHLILVDQSGVVRANGRTYPSVEELIDTHLNGGPPISSGGLQIVLKEPIGISEEKC